MPRPDRLPKSAEKIIKASKLLPCGMKLLWIEDYWLDAGPEGSYLTHERMAARLGMVPKTVASYRERMKALGLYTTGSGATAQSWYPALPQSLFPLPQKVDWRVAGDMATRMDGDWRALKAHQDQRVPLRRLADPDGEKSDPGGNGNRTRVGDLVTSVARATSMSGGDLGGGSPSVVVSEKPSPSEAPTNKGEVVPNDKGKGEEVDGTGGKNVAPVDDSVFAQRLHERIAALRAERAAKQSPPALRPSARDPLPEGKY